MNFKERLAAEFPGHEITFQPEPVTDGLMPREEIYIDGKKVKMRWSPEAAAQLEILFPTAMEEILVMTVASVRDTLRLVVEVMGYPDGMPERKHEPHEPR